MEAITVNTKGGHVLAARRFAPAGRAKAVVVMPTAMGVKQEFYFPFAQFLAQQGFAVLTFDYRGAGASVPPRFSHSLRGFKADLHDWAEDYNAALRAARDWQKNMPLLLVGHSLGGQLPALMPDNHLVDGILTVAAGSGYWRYNAPQLKRMVWLMWYVAVPLCTPAFGYFPGKKLRMVGDLPKGVIYQWARWCKSPHYMVDDEGRPMHAGFERMRVPLLALSFSDDELLSRRSIDSLTSFYRNAQVERRHIAPQDAQAKRIGHFGFFRPEFQPTLWQQALNWLEQCAQHRNGQYRPQNAASGT
ncbi:MAG: alpha/beta fold hydrolase [Bacillota bacterium]